MCGIFAKVSPTASNFPIEPVLGSQQHRGPDSTGFHYSKNETCLLGHNRLSIIDLSDAGRQPLSNREGNLTIVFNGEIYNFIELRKELHHYDFATDTDTEVLLAAFEKWGKACLDRLIGMFAFVIWNETEQKLFAARDRFGVKPLYYSNVNELLISSEIKTIHRAGLCREPNSAVWSNWLQFGRYGIENQTFWKDVFSLPPGHFMTHQNGKLKIREWYNLHEHVGDRVDQRSIEEVHEEYLSLLHDSVRLRFRSDVPVGFNLSGGVDSSSLLALVKSTQRESGTIKAFTFETGDSAYDETPWVEMMVQHTQFPLIRCLLTPKMIPDLASEVQRFQDEPFGGIPTLCMANLFKTARAMGTFVLLDGQGMDEQWGGYDYYRKTTGSEHLIQGANTSPTRPAALVEDFRSLSQKTDFPKPFTSDLRNLQYRDLRHTKLPRALRFNDRASMQFSCELREPFLDQRLIELAMSQADDRKIREGEGKWMFRTIASGLCPKGIVTAPKRPLQTPQREWLRQDLVDWANDMIQIALSSKLGSWFDKKIVLAEWKHYREHGGDNSFFIWQWISLGLTING